MGWIVVNILTPLLLPFIGVFFLKYATPLRVRVDAKGKYEFMLLVKDGQLGWSAAAMCASSYYEFSENQKLIGVNYATMPSQWDGILIPLFLAMIGAMFVAASGSVYSVDLIKNDKISIRVWVDHYAVFLFSAIVTFSSALMFAVIHFKMIPLVGAK